PLVTLLLTEIDARVLVVELERRQCFGRYGLHAPSSHFDDQITKEVSRRLVAQRERFAERKRHDHARLEPNHVVTDARDAAALGDDHDLGASILNVHADRAAGVELAPEHAIERRKLA